MLNDTARRLKMLGMTLFLLGLITGFAVSHMTNPRVGLAAHLEGVMNGTFLVVAGLVWTDLRLTDRMRSAVHWSLLAGTFVNWLSTLLAAVMGTSTMMPIAGAGFTAPAWQEAVVNAGLGIVGITMVFAAGMMAYGLRREP